MLNALEMMVDKTVSVLQRLVSALSCFISSGIIRQSERRAMGASGNALSAFGRNLSLKDCRVLLVFAFILPAAMTTGCSLPPYLASLDEILEQEGVRKQERYGYRCTAGAHRGSSAAHQENTVAALEAADNNGRYAFIEFDIQYSQDQRIVVYHDRRLFRLYGNLSSVGEKTFAELSKMTFGEIAAYDEVMGLLGKKLNIEIKSQGDLREDERLVDEVIADIRRRGRLNDVMISSISGDVVSYVNRNYPAVATGQVFWLTSSTYLRFEILTKKLYEEISTTQADYLMLHVANLNNIEDLLKLKPRGKTIVFWDFDDTMYIVHKDFSDRLWGESAVRTFFQSVRYNVYRFVQTNIVSAFRPGGPEK